MTLTLCYGSSFNPVTHSAGFSIEALVISRLRSTFLKRPCSTVPGPTSTTLETPLAIMFSMVWVQHTGEVSWATRFFLMISGSVTDCPVTFCLRTEYIFENEFVDDSTRRTMIVAPLFVGENVYGLLVIELPIQYSISVSSVASQLSVTLRSLYMMEEQNKAKQALQNSLERFIRDNTKLEEIAQKDELTRLYNRRGFIANSEKQLDDPANQDKVAVICYADMDNLKKINDKYGHDDGDFALCTIARILHESFRDSDVIGRFGGDEFVTLAITGSDIDVAKLKARIDMVTKRYNDEVQKPYPIEMSTGIYKFTITGKIDIYEILNNADELLYQEKIAKKTGRGNTQEK